MAGNSPTSINTYLQCPRLYYYRFILKGGAYQKDPVMIKGEIMHKVLQEFFDDDPPLILEDPREWAFARMRRLLRTHWHARHDDFEPLGLSDQEQSFHLKDCEDMAEHWLGQFLAQTKPGREFPASFADLRPIREHELFDPELEIRGFADAVIERNGEVQIIDYKTSSKFEITREHRLQLGIYAWLYRRCHGKTPAKAGILFLREGLHMIAVDDFLLRHAEEQCRLVRNATQSSDMKDYPQGQGYLCRALGGRCPCRQFEQE